MEAPYIHDTSVHNLIAPRIIVPIIIGIFNPKSVVDVGCGIGTFLHVFKECGVTDLLGIDGDWVDRGKLLQNIDLSDFIPTNLNETITIGRQFDIAMCLEVAEHLKETSAHTLVESLTSLSNIIIFSAAIPGQGGQNHINEQWVTYWEKIFNEHHFILYDIIRPQLWDNPNVFFWYKQNIVIFVKEGCQNSGLKDVSSNTIRNIVHPELFTKVSNTLFSIQEEKNHLENQLNRLLSGRYSSQTYLHIICQYIKLRFAKLTPKYFFNIKGGSETEKSGKRG